MPRENGKSAYIQDVETQAKIRALAGEFLFGTSLDAIDREILIKMLLEKGSIDAGDIIGVAVSHRVSELNTSNSTT